MITKAEVIELLHSTETYRVERTISKGDMDKFQEAICAFANDLPGSRKKGYLLIGAYDDGRLAGMKVDDTLLKKISGIRSDGNILPLPVMSVERFEFPEGDVLVAEVTPSLVPPVRYRGRTFVRIGPRRDIATEAEERILFERRASFMATFDATPCFGAGINDLDTEIFKRKFLPLAIDRRLLRSEKRGIEEQLAALGMYDLEHRCPTYAAIMLFGKAPRKFLPGAYLQFVCFGGETKSSAIEDEREFDDNYCTLLPKLESLLEMSVIKQYPVQVSMLREETVANYPYWAIRELLMNACMHRDLQSNAPIRLYEFSDHIEIMNAGGLYGNARPENFPMVNDYRNPLLASAMKTLGYVNKYNRGIGQVHDELEANGNPPAHFRIDMLTAFAVEVEKGTSQMQKGHKSADAKQEAQSAGKQQDENIDHRLIATSQTKERHKSDSQEGTSRATRGHKSKTLADYIENHRPFGSSVLTLRERIVQFCETPKSMAEIAEFLGVKDKRKARERYVDPQLGIALERTIPDKPTSRLQKYVAKKI